MSDSPSSARPGRFDAILTALTTMLLVLSIGMIGTGIAWPGGEADDGTADDRYTSLDPAAPVRLEIPKLDVVAAVWEIDIDPEGALDPPRDASTVGWWRDSAAPGAETGQTVITGHTVHTGGGSLNRIGTLEPGDDVDVISNSGRMRYSVDRVRYYSREEITEHAVELFGQETGNGNLVLITCADWNGEYYERNVIVFGTPLGQPEEPEPSAPTTTSEQAAD